MRKSEYYFGKDSKNEWCDLLNSGKNTIKSIRIQNSSASHKEFWANENLPFYQDAIQAFLMAEKTEDAFSFSEENKSNLLLESINDFNAKGYAQVPEEVLNRERSLRGNLNFYQEELQKSKREEEVDSTRVLSLSELVGRTQLELDDLIDSLETDYPQYYQLKYNEDSLSVADVQNLLDEETAFIEYFVGTDTCFVFTIAQEQGVIVHGINKIADINKELLDYYQSLKDPNADINRLKRQSSFLYDNLLRAALTEIPSGIKKLVIVPDDVLTNLPFGMMMEANNQYLGNRYDIQYQYSGRLWKMLKEKEAKDYSSDFTGFAYNRDNVNYEGERSCFDVEATNLMCSAKEIKYIQEILKGKRISIPNGNKQEIISDAGNSRILHLATHSCLDPQNADYSRIYFNDGYLTNLDLQLSEIGAELAVLSGCESGYGELVKGEGAMSISKGFFHAGCNSTLVSLWPVDDCSTAEIMKHFYKNLNQDKPKTEHSSKPKRII